MPSYVVRVAAHYQRPSEKHLIDTSTTAEEVINILQNTFVMTHPLRRRDGVYTP